MRTYYIPAFILLGIVSGCSVNSFRTPEPAAGIPAAARSAGTMPIIDVGLIKGAGSITFTTGGSCRLVSHDGAVIASLPRNRTWKAVIVDPAPGEYIYLLVAASMSSRERAEIKAADFQALGFETFIYENGGKRKIGGADVGNGTLYRVCIKRRFVSVEAAKNYQNAISDQLETFIIRYPVTEAGGTITVTDVESGDEYRSLRQAGIQGGVVTIRDIPVGVGYHWENREERRYGGEIILEIDDNGTFSVINRIELEEYLMGVVPSEMPKGFPLEALKAQAVAARSEVLAKLGKAHLDDPFDICADVHCQVYSGLSKRAVSTDRAVQETRGRVLMHDGAVIDAVYSAVCGGHTENAEHAWGGDGKPYLTGVYDGGRSLTRYGSLTREGNAVRWIDANPNCACNTTRGKILPDMEYTKKYFRWETTLTQKDLRNSLESYAAKSVGDIRKIVPLARGESGRITSLKIEGSSGSYIIKGELQIRKALSRSTLYSSCFYVRERGRSNGAPEAFVLVGAGFGHGVGMCQTGAAGLALRGVGYEGILKHYYQGSRVRRIY
ncbi:SpoIID/LytB domain-containing protein [bacterium]|nr:SpoIID/LytB domain-containing protein [bacterium]